MPNLESLFVQFENVKVIDASIPYSHYYPIDFSVSNLDLSTMKSPQDFEIYIENLLIKNNSKVAFGGYNEKRKLYQSSPLFNDDKNEERDIHIGMDLWVSAGTAVLAALDGSVYGFDFNSGKGNYGPTIILKHQLENHTFYTLYGHLSLDSIENLEIGTVFCKGQKLAALGDSSVNGGYAPHLHFQIIKNIEGNTSDYPGFCSLKDLDFYLGNCPDPNLLLKIQ